MERPRTRYLAGVCEALSVKYRIHPIIIRMLFIISSCFLEFTLLVYLVLCFTIPNYQKVSKKTKIKHQLIGFLFGIIGLVLIGIIVGFLAGDIMMMITMLGVASYLWAIISFFGGVLGLIIGRSIAERKEINNPTIPNIEN
jgi:phage shock protein PspC (stress-responsive transcriptional regulator)